MSAFKLNKNTVEEFVALVDSQGIDSKGGPTFLETSPEWRSVRYEPTVKVDQSLDPYSDRYCSQQIELYKEISGREVDQYTNEKVEFDLQSHIAGSNAYGLRNAPQLAVHYGRLSKLMRLAAVPDAASVLDMGCGWGLSSEFFATLGCSVTAVDINQAFVDLVEARSSRLNLNIRAVRSGFEDVSLPDLYDLVVFYECLHHAIRPWDILKNMVERLTVDGAVAFAGEPVQSIWWRHWGMRLDPLSIYCIRKYGWFESGWSREFITDAMNRCGLFVSFVEDSDPVIGPVVIGRKRNELSGSNLTNLCRNDQWHVEPPYLISKGNSSLWLNSPQAGGTIELSLNNFRGKPLALRIERQSGGSSPETVFSGQLKPGNNRISLMYGGPADYTFHSDAWQPRKVLGTPDDRVMSFHLDKIEFGRAGVRKSG